MRIVFCTDTLARGGKERQIGVLSQVLISRGHEVFWISMRDPAKHNYIKEYEFDEARISVLRRTGYWSGIFEMYRLIKPIKPDISLGWDMKSCFWLLVLHWFCRIRMVNGSIQHGVRKNTLVHRFRSLIARVSPFVWANSKAGLVVNGLKESDKARVIYNALIPYEGGKEFLADDMVKFQRRKSKDKSYRLIVTVANLLEVKDYPTVIQALAKLDMPFDYLIVGEGQERPYLESMVSRFGLDNSIHFLGRRTDVMSILENSDVFILASRGEGCSNAILEAMSAGVFVVASRVGGTPEILPEELGEMFEYQDVDGLVSVLADNWTRSISFDTNSPYAGEYLRRFSEDRVGRSFEKMLVDWIK